MNRSINKFLFISVGGLVALMVMGMLIAVILNTSIEQVRGVNLIEEWMVYRLGIYVVLFLCWNLICHWITRPRLDKREACEEEQQLFEQKRQNDLVSLKRLRWKLVGVLAFFEVVVIQQFGL